MFSKYRWIFFEIVCDKMFQIIIAIENWKNFDKRYKFENIIEIFLKKKQSNSNRFIECCELNTNNHLKNFVQSNDNS